MDISRFNGCEIYYQSPSWGQSRDGEPSHACFLVEDGKAKLIRIQSYPDDTEYNQDDEEALKNKFWDYYWDEDEIMMSVQDVEEDYQVLSFFFGDWNWSDDGSDGRFKDLLENFDELKDDTTTLFREIFDSGRR